MVLTQPGHSDDACNTAHHVSIPLWFSRNFFDAGSNIASDAGFHTTMVLTQPSYRRKEHYNLQVSIPLWFSRNMVPVGICTAKEFRFHTTMVLTQLTRI